MRWSRSMRNCLENRAVCLACKRSVSITLCHDLGVFGKATLKVWVVKCLDSVSRYGTVRREQWCRELDVYVLNFVMEYFAMPHRDFTVCCKFPVSIQSVIHQALNQKTTWTATAGQLCLTLQWLCIDFTHTHTSTILYFAVKTSYGSPLSPLLLNLQACSHHTVTLSPLILNTHTQTHTQQLSPLRHSDRSISCEGKRWTYMATQNSLEEYQSKMKLNEERKLWWTTTQSCFIF